MFHQLLKFVLGTIHNGEYNEVTVRSIVITNYIELLSQFFPFFPSM